MCSSPSSPSLEKIMERLDGLALQLVPLTTLLSEVQSIKGDISDIKKTVHDNTEKVNRLECRIMTVEKSISDMKKSHSEIKDLKEKVLQLETDLNSKEQWLRTNNVEIKGVPQKPNENLYDLLGKIGTKILYPVSKEKVNFITRVPVRKGNNTKNKPIIISFINRYAKEDFVAAGRAYKGLNISDVGFEGKEHIFINDHLTARNKQLLSQTKALAKEKNYKYIWVQHGKILVRFTDSSPPLHIRSEKDLSKIN
ncbi:uncharacterized protein LOC126976048 [Leptidea sinapis]|uniref:uncharacterized protein LOC126976048 n=1 Tax=Leptidea sinapis TaxID=189913 RepID=UPI0021C2C36E|nr:uncharacterized protein LOC126976048 [Leptidea sinapis]